MGFCTKCGKQINDGEICSCQQAPQMNAGAYQQVNNRASQSGIVNDFISTIKGLFTSPADTIAAFVAKANIILIAILIGGQAIINVLVRLFNMIIANAKTPKYYSEFDMLLGNTVSKPYGVGAIFKNMFLELLLVAVSAAVFAGIVMLLVKMFNKTNATYVQGLAVYALMSFFGIPAAFLSWITGLTSVKFLDKISSCIDLFAEVCGLAFVYIAVRTLCKDDRKAPYITAISFVVVSFATWILRLMF